MMRALRKYLTRHGGFIVHVGHLLMEARSQEITRQRHRDSGAVRHGVYIFLDRNRVSRRSRQGGNLSTVPEKSREVGAVAKATHTVPRSDWLCSMVSNHATWPRLQWVEGRPLKPRQTVFIRQGAKSGLLLLRGRGNETTRRTAGPRGRELAMFSRAVWSCVSPSRRGTRTVVAPPSAKIMPRPSPEGASRYAWVLKPVFAVEVSSRYRWKRATRATSASARRSNYDYDALRRNTPAQAARRAASSGATDFLPVEAENATILAPALALIKAERGKAQG